MVMALSSWPMAFSAAYAACDKAILTKLQLFHASGMYRNVVKLLMLLRIMFPRGVKRLFALSVLVENYDAYKPLGNYL